MFKSIQQKIALNAYHLKMIALITMLLDHIARILFPEMVVLKIVGRMAFIIYSFLIVEGFIYTKDTKKYLFRLLVFAIISEIPYDLAFGNLLFDPTRQNVFFSLSAGLIGLMVLQCKISSDLKVLLITVIVTIANMFHVDYYYLGIFQIICFYAYRNSAIKKFLTVGILNVFFMFRIGVQAAAIMGFIPIYLYNGKQGKKTGKIFYWFYPLHILFLWMIKKLMRG